MHGKNSQRLVRLLLSLIDRRRNHSINGGFSMKKILGLLVLVSSLSAFAAKEKVSINYSGFEGWGRTYYACDYVEYQAESFLKLFGATEIDVRCTGGIQPYGSAWPI